MQSEEKVESQVIKSKNRQGYLLFLMLSVRKYISEAGDGPVWEGYFEDITKEVISGTGVKEKKSEPIPPDLKYAELVHALIDSGSDVIFAKDAQGEFVFVNKTFSELVGMPRDEISGKTSGEIVNYSNRMAVEEFCALKSPMKKRAYITVTLLDDSVEYFLPDVKQISVSGYEKPLTLITARNVTPIAKAEMAMSKINDTLSAMVSKRTQELELSNRNFSVLFEKGDEIKFLTRANGKILKTNEKARGTFGISENEIPNPG